MNFRDIPQFPRAHYEVDVGWGDLDRAIERYREAYGVELSPDYQRSHVWTEAQQRAYVEFVLQGGEVSKSILWNSVGWDGGQYPGVLELVDGKQRLEAVRRFMGDELAVFGRTRSRFVGALRIMQGFKFRIASLPRERVLELYLSINGGGTPHTPEELERVRVLLKLEKERMR